MLYHKPQRVQNIKTEMMQYQDKDFCCVSGLARYGNEKDILHHMDISKSANSILGKEEEIPCAVQMLMDIQGNCYEKVYSVKDHKSYLDFLSYSQNPSNDPFIDSVREKYFSNAYSPIIVPLAPEDSEDVRSIFECSGHRTYLLKCNVPISFTTQDQRYFMFCDPDTYQVETDDFQSFRITNTDDLNFSIVNATPELVDKMFGSECFTIEGNEKQDTLLFLSHYGLRYAPSIGEDAVNYHLLRVVPEGQDTVAGIEDSFCNMGTFKKDGKVSFSYGKDFVDEDYIPFTYDITVDLEKNKVIEAVRNAGECFADAEFNPQQKAELIKTAREFAPKAKEKEQIGLF